MSLGPSPRKSVMLAGIWIGVFIFREQEEAGGQE